MNVTGFRIVDYYNATSREFHGGSNGWESLDPKIWPGAGKKITVSVAYETCAEILNTVLLEPRALKTSNNPCMSSRVLLASAPN